MRIQHTGLFNEDSFVDELSNRSIFEIIGFPDEGIAHFHRMRDSYLREGHRDRALVLAHQSKMTVEATIIRERIRRRKLGERTGKEMDDNYTREQLGQNDGNNQSVEQESTSDGSQDENVESSSRSERTRSERSASEETESTETGSAETDSDESGSSIDLPGEEAIRPVPLRGQALVDRITRLALSARYSGQDDGRQAVADAHAEGNGLDYQTEEGLERLLARVGHSGTGILEVWLDAMCVVKIEKLRREGGKIENLERWEIAYLEYLKARIQILKERLDADSEADEEAASPPAVSGSPQ